MSQLERPGETGMNYLKSFLPWIAFAVVATQFDWRWSGLTGLVISAALLVLARREGRQNDALIIEWSALAFFALLTATAFAFPASPLKTYTGALTDAWLALTAWGSLAIGKPFTLGIARTMTPPELWGNPVFKRVNVVITLVWAASFTVTGLAGIALLNFAPHATAALITLKVLGFAVPVAFTIRYPRIVRARAEKAA
ncbi:hypothetical protein Amsp01_051240 [Amycolatopsis sp. NBRC 101858]|uniref:hypothetical protein n=1 Tax=Amycolatopsis sp. NBRC 101858 TaxID=3032200 RepID=UPI0024A091B4|nr:hypothetical protein [Amycolatopsis sp. NBRC 101858]GLY39100.1 hypothetical protein Amsp01_051240 [Amycolatopsis sp. NBRC 101858]